MHSWAFSLRKQTSRFRFFAGSRSVYTETSKSNNSTSKCGQRYHYNSYGSNKGGRSWFHGSLLGSVCSGAVIAGSSLGVVYCSSFYNRDSLVAYADSGAQTTTTTTTTETEKKKANFLFKDSYRRKVFFKYEKRIRTRSPPEKVFEYFASFRTPSGEVYMTPTDLMRAVVPVFPPSEADTVRGGYLEGELITSELHCAPSEFFMLFDTDSDGLISFPEYIFFVTILSIPESSFAVAFKMFDQDGDGGIDREEFKKVMALMRAQNRQGASHRDGKRYGMRVSGSVENGGLLQYFFGKDGDERLEQGKFVQFFRDLHDEMLRLEFTHYDYKLQGTISARDFALSMVASADMTCINRFLDRAEELNNEPSLKDVRINFEEFKSFAELRKQLEPFSMAIFSYGKVNGLLSKQDFKRAAEQVCGISLTNNVVELVFYMFDANRDGSLSSDEFVRVLEKREMDVSRPRESGFAGLISCWSECTKRSSSKKSF